MLVNREDCISGALRLLNNKNTYSHLFCNSLKSFREELSNIVDNADGIVLKMEKGFLLRDHYMDPYLYTLRKIHKDPMNPPGSPTIAGINGLSSEPSDYIDYFLQPLVKSLPPYIKDSGHLLDILSFYKCEDHTGGFH